MFLEALSNIGNFSFNFKKHNIFLKGGGEGVKWSNRSEGGERDENCISATKPFLI